MTERIADLILVSGRLWDGRELHGRTAIAIGGGRILATGADREILAMSSPHTRVIDSQSRRVMPGLIDSHMHMVRAGTRWNHDLRWEGLGSLHEALNLLAHAASSREPDRWIGVVGGWNPGQFSERRPPSRRELDEAAPNHPVFVQRNYMEAFLNTTALEEMGWDEQPTGRVSGAAALGALRERLEALDFEGEVAGTEAMLRELNRVGLTGAIDAGGFGMTPASYRPYFELWQRGERGFRARLLVGPSRPGAETEDIEDWTRFVHPGFGDEYLRYLGAGEVLLFAAHDMEGIVPVDVSSQTGRVTALSERLAAIGWPVHVHAILDDSVGSVLTAWEQVDGRSRLADLRYTITHADQVGRDNLLRVRDMGLGLTIQHGMAFRAADCISTWGEDRVTGAPPLRTMIELGIPVGAGSDATVVSSYNPWVGVWWMVSGQSIDGSPPRVEDQRLSRDEALALYTSGSAWFSFEEETRGNLRPGSDADVVVLSKDPLTVSVDEIPLIESDLTIVGGEVAYASPAFATVS